MGDVWKKAVTDKIQQSNLAGTIGTRQPHGGNRSRRVYIWPPDIAAVYGRTTGWFQDFYN